MRNFLIVLLIFLNACGSPEQNTDVDEVIKTSSSKPPIETKSTTERPLPKGTQFFDGDPCELEYHIVQNASLFFKKSAWKAKVPIIADDVYICEFSPRHETVEYNDTLHSYIYTLTGPKSGFFTLFGIEGAFVCEDCDMSLSTFGCLTLKVTESDIRKVIEQSKLVRGEQWHYEHIYPPCSHSGTIFYQGIDRNYTYYPTGYMSLEGFDDWLMCYDCTVNPEWVAFDSNNQ